MSVELQQGHEFPGGGSITLNTSASSRAVWARLCSID